jgi:ankyrin repeat protein
MEIFRAARKGNEAEVVRLLDADPALLESMDGYRQRPLGAAAEAGHLGVVTLLIESGADINATGYLNGTALHWAGYRGYEDVVALLLSKGAQASRRNHEGTTALMWAAQNRHPGVVRMLVQHMGGMGLDGRNYHSGWTALHYAAFRGHEELVRYLLMAGSDPTITDFTAMTPRALAQRRGYSRCVAVFAVRQHMCRTHQAPRCIFYTCIYYKRQHALSTAIPSGGLASPPLTLTCFF